MATGFERFEVVNNPKTQKASHLSDSLSHRERSHTIDSTAPLKAALCKSEELLQSLEQQEYWKLDDVRILYKLKSELIDLERAIRRPSRVWEGMPRIPVRSIGIDL